MKVPVQDLIEATRAICLIPSRAGIMSSEFIRLRADKKTLKLSLAAEMYGTTSAAASEPTDKAWTFYVDRASFSPFVNIAEALGTKKPFQFQITTVDDKPQLIIRSGARKAVFQSVNAIEGYSDKDEFKGKVLKLTRDQKDWLRLAVKYATSDPTFAHLNCVYLSKRTSVMSSNQLAALVIEDKAAPMSVPLPLLLLSILDSDKVESILVSETFARVELSCGYLCQLTNAKASADFPHKAISKNVGAGGKTKKRFVLKASSLLAALKRLEAYIATIVRRDMTVTITGKTGEKLIKLIASMPSGKFEELVRIESALSEDIHFELLLAMLLPLADVAKKIGQVTVRYNDDSPFHFSAQGLQLIVSRKS